MAENSIIPSPHTLSTLNADDIASANFEILRRAGRKSSTVDQYTRTEKLWVEFCAAQGLNSANFEVVYVDAFFQTVKDAYSRVTLQNMLSHLRKLVEAIAASADDTAALYIRQLQALKQYKIDAEWGGANSRKRAGKRIDTSTVWAAIHADAPTPLARARNAALYAVLFFAGLRREEVRAALAGQRVGDRDRTDAVAVCLDDAGAVGVAKSCFENPVVLAERGDVDGENGARDDFGGVRLR